jgi:hypothetical protein
MSRSGFVAAFALAATCIVTAATAQPADPSKYPDWKGQWQMILARNVGGQDGAAVAPICAHRLFSSGLLTSRTPKAMA